MKKIKALIDPDTSSVAKLLQFLANAESARSLLSTIFGLVTTFGTVSLAGLDLLNGRQDFISTLAAVSHAPLAVRLFLMGICAVALGTGLGGVSFYLTRKNTSTRATIVSFLGIAWALLLVVCAQALADTSGRTQFPEFALFLVMGLGLCMWLLSYQMRAHSGPGTSAPMVEDRGNMIALFVVTAIFAGVLVSISEIG